MLNVSFLSFNVEEFTGCRFGKKEFNKFEKIWSYASKSLLITRHFLNASLRVCHWATLGCKNVDDRVISLVTKLKLFALVSIPLNLASIPQKIMDVWLSVKHQDFRGTLLAGMTVTLIMTDILDSLATFTNAALTTLSANPIQWVSDLGLPFAFTMIGVGTISRAIRLIGLGRFYLDLKNSVSEGQLDEFIHLLFEQGSVSELKVERRLNGKILELLKSLTNENDSKDEILAKLFESLQIEMKIHLFTICANAFNFSALILFVFPVGSPALPFFLLGVGFTLRAMIQAYQDWD